MARIRVNLFREAIECEREGAPVIATTPDSCSVLACLIGSSAKDFKINRN